MPSAAAVTLRSIETTDAVRIQRYASDARLAETCGIPHPYPPDGGESFVQSCLADRDAGTHYPLAVLLDGELVGIMNLNRIDRDRGTAELDYWIAVPFWGRGIATAAARLAMTLAFAGLRLQVVESVCLEENPAPGRVLEKAGFTEVGSGIDAGRYGSRFAKRSLRRFRLQRENWIAQGAAGTGNS